VARAGIGEIGVIYDPNRDELFVGRRDQLATLNGRPISVSRTETLGRSILGTGFSYDRAKRRKQIEIWGGLHDACQGIRREGSAALGIAWLAAGRTDGFYEAPINPWDISAGAIIGASAGATVTSLGGEQYGIFDKEILLSNGLIHGELQAALAAMGATGA
jgi:myo-inositol-1(or 4)-monophosphatase